MRIFRSIGVKGIGFLLMLMLCLGLSGSIVMAEELGSEIEAVTSTAEKVSALYENEQAVQEDYLAVENSCQTSIISTETMSTVEQTSAKEVTEETSEQENIQEVTEETSVQENVQQIIGETEDSENISEETPAFETNTVDEQTTEQNSMQEDAEVDLSNTEVAGVGMGSVGQAHVLGIYLDFLDQKFDDNDTINDFWEIINNPINPASPTYPYESLYAYYQRASYGRLTITGDVVAYTAKNTRQWYIDNGGIDVLIKEVIEELDDQINYAKYDTNGNADGSPDGVVDGVYLHCAGGCPEGWSTTFWSAKHTVDLDVYDGVSFKSVVVLHESSNSSSGQVTIIHETGHVLGLPDLYSYVKHQMAVDWRTGTLTWDMMENNTGDIDAYFKWILGWIEYKDITRVVANDDGISVYQGNELSENITVNQDQTGLWVDILQKAYDSDEMSETGGFIIVSNQNAQTEEEAKYSNFFMIVLDQYAGNQSVTYGYNKKIPTGFRVYKIQAEKSNGVYKHSNSDYNATIHNLLIECMDYDYTAMHMEAFNGSVPVNIESESYGCYLPVGETFTYATNPSTNFQEDILVGFTGIWIKNMFVDSSAGQGTIRIGYSKEGSSIDPDEVTIVYDNKAGIIKGSYLQFTVSGNIAAGTTSKAYIYVNDVQHTVSVNIENMKIKVFADDFNLDDFQQGDSVKIVFPEGTFQIGYDKDKNKVYNKEVEVVLSVGPVAEVTEKTDVEKIDSSNTLSNTIVIGDHVYYMHWSGNGPVLVCMDRENPVNATLIPIIGCTEERRQSITDTKLYTISDNRILLQIKTGNDSCNFYWINAETGNVIATKKTTGVFAEDEIIDQNTVISDGKFYYIRYQDRHNTLICLYEENGQILEMDFLINSSSKNPLMAMYSVQDPSTGENKMLFAFQKDNDWYELKEVDDTVFFEMLKKNKNTELDTDTLYTLDSKSYFIPYNIYIGSNKKFILNYSWNRFPTEIPAMNF